MKYSIPSWFYLHSFIIWMILVWFLSCSDGYAQSSSSPKEIVLKAVGGLQYDIVRFQVSPGEQIRLVLENTDDMDHNLIITQQGRREEIVKAALQMGGQGPVKNFVPESPDVLYHIDVLSPGEKDTLTFPAPMTEGVYPYVCTYPGHGVIMYGAMYVTTGELPPLSEDPHIPEHRRNGKMDLSGTAHQAHEKKWHPYELTPPYFYRIFMPGSGPASIAVRLPDNWAYCWDAGVCRLRYIWTGDFLDISEPWSIKGDATAKVLGTVIYREEEDYPLRVDDQPVEVNYLGYRLVDGGFPQFHYTINGVEVYELIHPAEDGSLLIRQFNLPNVRANVTFTYTPEPAVKVTSDRGKWNGNNLALTSSEAREFSIFIEPASKSKNGL